jgi:2-polyprenyl-3-methyl-5-hydroxy-6-metoxy-1,4-benzoquinol methylase
MISCTKCRNNLKVTDFPSVCEHCNEKFEPDSNGIIFFHKEDLIKFVEHTKEGLSAIIKGEGYHFWFLTRREYLEEKIKNNLKSTDFFVEVGAGSGSIAEKAKDICNDTAVIDIQEAGLICAKNKGIKKAYQMNINKNVFYNHFDAVGLFDVLEHMQDDDLVLHNISKMLKSKGKLFITVPAFQFLWNKRDEIEKHQRRYSMADLKNILTANNFRIIESRYYFFSIFPLLILRSIIWNLSKKNESKNDYLDNIQINPLLNKILLYLTRVENVFFKYIKPPFGGSLYMLAEKIT